MIGNSGVMGVLRNRHEGAWARLAMAFKVCYDASLSRRRQHGFSGGWWWPNCTDFLGRISRFVQEPINDRCGSARSPGMIIR
jgi:hypothetical protein